MSRLDQKLIDYAYGELSEAETKKVDALLEKRPELQARVRQLKSTRMKLNLLQDIPEAQLSTERLRDAILGQGLRPESRPERAAWITSLGAVTLGGVAIAAIVGTVLLYPRSLVAPATGSVAKSQVPGASNKGTLVAAQERPTLDKSGDPRDMSSLSNSASNSPAWGGSNLGGFKSSGAREVNSPRAGAGKDEVSRRANTLASNGASANAVKPDLASASLARANMTGANAILPNSRLSDSIGAYSVGGYALDLPVTTGTSYKSNQPEMKGVVKKVRPRGTTVASHKRHTLVVIDGEDDAATGLPKAQEVADASHVVLSS